MIFTETKLYGAYIIEIEKSEDERGFFARTWDKKIFQKNRLGSKVVQCNISFNKKKGILRGIHFQKKPYEEEKLVRCINGCIFDVIVDLRSTSKTYKEWFGVELSSKNYKSIFIPKGFAHGFQTLEDNTEVFYQMSQYHMPEYSNGFRWDDSSFRIKWPIKHPIISQKDLSWSNFEQY